jgi:hypothetical protein
MHLKAVIRASVYVMSIAVVLAFATSLAEAQPTPQEVFVGPFLSWRHVHCSGQDDTAMLQDQLNRIGRSASPVLYIDAGTCRITSTLHLGRGAGGNTGVKSVTILGHDPSDTRIVWAGPAGKWQRMLEADGVAFSRFGRITWDGGGAADIVYFDNWSGSTDYFPTANRHEDEVFQNLWSGGGIAFYVGASGFAGSEWEYVRCRFLGPMEAGIYLTNYNALDHWVWDSLFQNIQHAVTNYLPDRNGGAGGAWGVNRSVFLNNGDDMAIANASFFSSRWNYSRGARIHVHSYPIGNAASPWTSQGEVVIDPSTSKPQFLFGTVGALGLLDATVRNGGGNLASVVEGYAWPAGGDLWALGNTFSNPNPNVYTAGNGGQAGRMYAHVDDHAGQQIADPGPPSLPPTPPAASLPVIEVQNGDIAAALQAAGTRQVIVHVPYGTYWTQRTLEVGPNVILTGDGYGATSINGTADPVLHLAGPSHAVLRDFSVGAFVNGQRVGTGIAIDNADQPDGLIHSEGWIAGRNNIGWELSGLHNTMVDLLDDMTSANTHVDANGANPSVDYSVTASVLHIFNGAGSASDELYSLQRAEIVAETRYYEANPGGVSSRLVAPNSSGRLVIDSGSFAPNLGTVDTSTFNGMLTINGLGATAHGPRVFGPNSLVMGYDFGWRDDTVPPTFTGQPYALLLPRHNNGSGGTDRASDSIGGVSDLAQYMRDHLAPLRMSRPRDLRARSADATDVRLYRVGAWLTKSGIRVSGASNSVALAH